MVLSPSVGLKMCLGFTSVEQSKASYACGNAMSVGDEQTELNRQSHESHESHERSVFVSYVFISLQYVKEKVLYGSTDCTDILGYITPSSFGVETESKVRKKHKKVL